MPIVCIGLGAAIFSLPQITLDPLPTRYPEITERFSEFVAIIALIGAGLKLDRIFSFRRWGITWRLIAVTMPLCIAAITLIAGWWMGLSWTVALLVDAGTLTFFGIRGVSSVYYIAYGLNHMEGVQGEDCLWVIVGLIILLSILMHGVTVTPIMRMLDRSHGRDPDANEASPPPGLKGPASTWMPT